MSKTAAYRAAAAKVDRTNLYTPLQAKLARGSGRLGRRDQ